MLKRTLQAEKFFFDLMLPIRLYYTRSSEKAHWHNHEFTEIAIVLAGSGIYETEFSVEEIHAGDVLVMPAGGAHQFHDEVGIEQINILFQFEKLSVPSRDISRHPGFSALFRLNPEYCHRMRFYPHFKLCDNDLKRVRFWLTDAFEAQEAQTTGFALSVYGAFLQTIPILLDNYAPNAAENGLPHRPERLSACLDFMERNFRKEQTIDALAQRAGMTPASFMRHFKAATGCTPLEYLIRLRLDEARLLLLDESLSVAEAAQRAGFTDSNYFARIFRRKNGLSPREFRNKHAIV